MITVDNLRFTYPGAKEDTIKGLSFHIEKGEVFGFLGPSGAGKSTTQKILINILKGWRGEISLLGKNLLSWKRDLYEHIGVSFEFPNLYPKLTALENLDFFASLYESKTENPRELLSLLGLEQDADKRTENFSKGMKMRLNLCRALLNRPELVFLDEPTSGQDPAHARRIKDLILDLKHQGRTVFLTTHNMSVAEELCDRVAFIVDGGISLIDTPRNLMLKKQNRIVRADFVKNGQSLSREFPLEALGTNRDFLTLLKTETISALHSQEDTMEDIFIRVTGRELA